MKLQTDTTPVQTFGSQGLVNFGIREEDVQKLLTILGQNFYSDPVASMVRELMTNAWDAHLDSGNTDTPVKIYLPSYMSPQFVIRDFGVGMSKEFLETIYVSFGASTKATSNNSNGAFGLGSKSPFAVSSAWSVNSYHNGTKYTYSAFTSESSGRQMMFAGSQETSEPNGVEVVVPLETKHKSAIEEAVRFYGRWWTKQPIIDDETRDLSWWGDQETLLEGSDWKMMAQSISDPGRRYGYYNKENVFKLGDVPYKIPADHDALYRSLTKEQRFFLNKNLFLEFNIGELQPTPNRENIVFDEKAVKIVAARLETVRKEVDKTIQDSIVNADSLKAAIKIRQEATDKTPTSLDDTSFTWQGLSVASTYSLPKGMKLMSYSKDYNSRVSGSSYSQTQFKIGLIGLDSKVYFNDLGRKKKRMQAIKTLCSSRYESIYVLEPVAVLDGKNTDGSDKLTTAGYDDICDEIKTFVIDKLSDVEIDARYKPVSATKNKSKIDRTKFRGYEWHTTEDVNNRGVRAFMQEIELDKTPDEVQYFLPVKGIDFDAELMEGAFSTLQGQYSVNVPYIRDTRYGSDFPSVTSEHFTVNKSKEWGKVLNYIFTALDLDIKLYVIPSARVPKLGSTWVPFFDYLKTLIPLYEDVAASYLNLMQVWEENLYNESQCTVLHSVHDTYIRTHSGKLKTCKIGFADMLSEKLGHGNHDFDYKNDTNYSVIDLVRESYLIRHKLQDKDWMQDASRYLLLAWLFNLDKEAVKAKLPKCNTKHISNLEKIADAKYPLMNIRDTPRDNQQQQELFLDYIEQCINK